MKKYLYIIGILLAVAGGCEKNTAELPTADDLTAYAGKYRAKLEFAVPAGTTACKIFYNSGSVKELPVTDATIRQSEILEGMAEGEQVLRVVTLNAAGETSLPRGVKVNVYGDDYQRTLKSRTLLDKVEGTNTFDLTFEAASAGEIDMWVVYTNTSGGEDSVQVSPAATTAHITGIKTEEGFRYYSVFLPEPDALDEFRSATSRGGIKAPVTLVNAVRPFTTESTGHWWTDGERLMKLIGWTHEGSLISWTNRDNDNPEGFISIFAHPPAGGFLEWSTNNKVYQTVYLDAGEYQLVFHVNMLQGGALSAYGVATTDAVLPNHDMAEYGVLGSVNLSDGITDNLGGNTDRIIDFTVPVAGNVTIGWVYNTWDVGHQVLNFRMSGVELYQIL
jgi:hypothetical protein